MIRRCGKHRKGKEVGFKEAESVCREEKFKCRKIEVDDIQERRRETRHKWKRELEKIETVKKWKVLGIVEKKTTSKKALSALKMWSLGEKNGRF